MPKRQIDLEERILGSYLRSANNISLPRCRLRQLETERRLVMWLPMGLDLRLSALDRLRGDAGPQMRVVPRGSSGPERDPTKPYGRGR